MAYTSEQIEASTQLDRARASLGEALGQTQDISSSGLDVEHVSASLAKSVQNIFNLQKSGISSSEAPSYILQAMDHLRETLMLLQDVRSDAEALARITSTVAHILALLYPVSKIVEQIERANKGAAPEDEAPLDLQTEVQKAGDSHEPIPLVAKPPALPLRSHSSLPPPGTAERRIDTRRTINVDIGIHSHTNFFTGFSQDISSGGLFVATYDILNIGTELNVNFSVPNGPVLSLDGMVRWIREYNDQTPDMEPGMGIQFSEITGEDQTVINQYIAKNPPIFFEDGD